MNTLFLGYRNKLQVDLGDLRVKRKTYPASCTQNSKLTLSQSRKNWWWIQKGYPLKNCRD